MPLKPLSRTISEKDLVWDTGAGVFRNVSGDPRRANAARRGGGYRVRSRITADGEVKEVIALAAGGFASNNTEPQGGGLDAAKPGSSDRNAILQKCYELFVSDPLGGQIAETTRNFIFGSGTSVTFDDATAQQWVNRFRAKNMIGEQEKCMGAMSVYQGDEYLWLRPITEDVAAGRRRVWIAGDTMLTLIDPQNITGIRHNPTDPNDAFAYLCEYKDEDKGGEIVKIAIPDHRYYDPDAQAALGCIIHIKFNADPNDPFGNPDYLRVGEWMENYKEYLRDGVIINKLYRSPCYDITIIDGDENDVDAAIARYRGWKIGSNPVHNDKEEWKILEFKGPNSSQSEARRAILLIIAAGVGFAEYMLADGSNANLASTTTQELPVLKKFESRQDSFKTAFMLMYQIVLMHASVHGGLPASMDDFNADYYWPGAVEFPPLVRAEERDVEQVNSGAVEDGYMSLRTAAKRIGLNLADELRKKVEDAVALAEAEAKIMEEREKRGLVTQPENDPDDRNVGDNDDGGGSGDGE